MRLIDADALMTEFMDSDLDHLQRDDWREVIQIVTDAPTVNPEPHWIPVTENTLPEAESMYRRPTKRYLCQRESGGVRQFFVGARLCDPKGYLKNWWDWYGVKIHNAEVVAYMPLPKSYKGVTE